MLSLVKARGLEHQIEVDSAGTAGYHIGERADHRALRHAERRGIALPSRARKFEATDFDRFDYVLAMDTENLGALRRLAGGRHEGKLHLLRDFEPEAVPGSSVPDPYYGGTDGFEEVLDLCQAACEGLLQHLIERHGLE